MQCKSCGAQNPDNLLECAYCGAAFATAPRVAPVTAAAPAPTITASATPTSPDYAIDLPQYYKQAFAEFDRKPQGGPQFKFNWGAFWFGPFWYFFRGMWLKAILYLALVFGTAGFLMWLPWIYSFGFGTYDLYLLRKHGKQFW